MEKIIDARALRLAREAKGWDQRTLAHTANVNASVISRLERGLQTDLKASVLVALAHALEIPVDALVTTTTSFSPPSLVTNLSAILAEIERLPPLYQRQIAALLYGYLTTIPRQEEDKDDNKESPG